MKLKLNNVLFLIIPLIFSSCKKKQTVNFNKIEYNYKVDLTLTKYAYGDKTIITPKKEKEYYTAFEEPYVYFTTRYNKMIESLDYVYDHNTVVVDYYDEYKLQFTNMYLYSDVKYLSFTIFTTILSDRGSIDKNDHYIIYNNENYSFPLLESFKLYIMNYFMNLDESEKDITYIPLGS